MDDKRYGDNLNVGGTADTGDIDFVVTWVDCNDPEWKKVYSEFTGRKNVEGANRFRDWGIFKYWFRAVEKYAPWVHRVYLVTCGQKPDFLNIDHPKLRFVTHQEFIDEKYLPTFNSNVIELNLKNIPDLSERFVLFNDDLFLNSPVRKEDFFVNGLPCDCAVLDMVIPLGQNDPFYHTILNDVDIINKYYNKKEVIRMNKGAWYKLQYKEGLIRNLCLTPWKYFSGFKDYHVVSCFLKSSFEAINRMEPEAYERTCNNHFRGWSDITQHLIRYYQLCEGKFYPMKRAGKFFEIGSQTEEILKAVKESRLKYICLNDDKEDIDFEAEKNSIINAFEEKFPSKSSFEL